MSDEHPRRRGPATAARLDPARATVLDLAGRLREDAGRPLRVVDLGGGTGGLAVPLAGAGHDVTVVDPSPDALASLDRRAREVGVADRITGVQGDATALRDLLGGVQADLVCCHDVLEFVDEPGATLEAVAAVLAPGGLLSIVAAQRLAAVLARALAGRFGQAQTALTDADGRWGADDPLPRRFDPDGMRGLVETAGLEVTAVHGVRLFTDLVPATFLDSDADRAALGRLEAAVAQHPSYAFLDALAASLHLIARRPA